jgi:TRAP-type C4-dicarboxylate transport system permease small subunit
MTFPRTIRKSLDGLYAAAGVSAGIALVGIFLLVLYQIACRSLGYATTSVDELAAYAYVATTFLGLSASQRARSHIRVSLLLDNLRGRVRKVTEILAGTASIALAGWLAYQLFFFVLDSWQYHEVSQGVIPMQLWIPQSTMCIGAVVFFVALVDDLAAVLIAAPERAGLDQQTFAES